MKREICKFAGVVILTCQRSYLLIGLMVTFLGCGGGTEAVPVTGTVTYKGKPIAKINVMFMPTDKEGIVAQGTSDEKGNSGCKLSTRTMAPSRATTRLRSNTSPRSSLTCQVFRVESNRKSRRFHWSTWMKTSLGSPQKWNLMHPRTNSNSI